MTVGQYKERYNLVKKKVIKNNSSWVGIYP